MKNKSVINLGLMSGTSVDGIDASLVISEGKEDHVLLHTEHKYPENLRKDILGLIHNPNIDLNTLTRIHYEIGEAFAKAAAANIKAATKKKFLSSKKPLLSIGAHGQTVFHDPEAKRTMQIGEGSIIAARTGITTVSDFRMADTAGGGEGAPLLPVYHRRLFEKEKSKGIVVHNLGGISNFTYMNKTDLFALDTGPANCLLDGAIQVISGGRFTFDKNGELARAGKPSDDLLRFLKSQKGIQEFCKKRAPKSTGRELFSPVLLEQAMSHYPKLFPEDIMSSLAQFTVDLIVDSYKKEIGKKPLSKIVFAGGGTKNTYLLELIRKAMGEKIEFLTMEDFGWNSQALESQAFAYFSYMALKGEPITESKTTGIKKPMVCGKISPGDNWKMAAKIGEKG